MNEITGFLVTEPDGQGNREPLKKYRVSLRIPGSLFRFSGTEIASAVTSDTDGKFSLDPIPNPEAGGTRDLDLVAQDPVGRVLPFAPGDGQPPRYVVTAEGHARITDRPGASENFGNFVVRKADAKGLKVTLGTGQVSRYSEGNAVTTLMDQDAFAYAAAMMRAARKELLMSQLFFALPKKFHTDPAQEEPNLIFAFAPPTLLDQNDQRLLQAGDARPERLIVDTAALGVDTRLLLHAFTIPLFLRLIAGALFFPFFKTHPIAVVRDKLDADMTNADEAARYFGDAGATNVKVRGYYQPLLTSGAMHAKLVMQDRTRMLSIGSPFGQSYVDDHNHRIDSFTRGGATGFPKHDAGFALTGPACADVFDTLKLLWNHAAAGDPLPADAPNPVPAPPPTGPSVLNDPADGVCAVQIVRTLSCDQFTGMPDGEKGILEAYLRGIASAQDFIYLENQYFTNDAIADALVEALKKNIQLQVIVLLNIEPDIPTYPFKQRRLITRMRRKLAETATGPARFRVFTRWTHEIGTRTRILPIYVHAKAAIIDNTWATVGSANLDGVSLDSSLPSDILHNLFQTREARAIELNAVFFDQAAAPDNVVDKLRRKLWAEHLGYMNTDGTPRLTEALLQAGSKPNPGGWLKFWSDHAEATLKHLKETPGVTTFGKGRVLPWPTDNTTHDEPRDHITTLGMRSYAVAPLKSTRAFEFKQGRWKPGSKPRMDFD